MNVLKRYAIVLFISFLIFLIVIIFFWPIFKAKNLIFPYAINQFDIASRFPKIWFYIKLIYCISCFFNLFLLINSFCKFILFKKNNVKNNYNNKIKNNNNSEKFNLLLGTDSTTQKNIYIPEKGLYQNILITGTIGSR